MDRKQLLMMAAGGSAATVLGVFLPWAKLGGILSLSGIEGGDGKIVLALGIIGTLVAAAALLGKSLPLSRKASMLVGTICLALAAVVCVIDFLNISGAVTVGLGLWLCLAGSIVGTAGSFLAWRHLRSEQAGAPQTAESQS